MAICILVEVDRLLFVSLFFLRSTIFPLAYCQHFLDEVNKKHHTHALGEISTFWLLLLSVYCKYLLVSALFVPHISSFQSALWLLMYDCVKILLTLWNVTHLIGQISLMRFCYFFVSQLYSKQNLYIPLYLGTSCIVTLFCNLLTICFFSCRYVHFLCWFLWWVVSGCIWFL